MTAINVLTPGFTSSNGTAFLFPLVVHRNALRSASLDVKFVERAATGITDCDVLAIDSKEFRNDWSTRKSQTLDLLSSFADSGTKIVWFDTTDGTGTLQAQVLPIVDRYLKSLLLSDSSRYTERIYGGRVHSDFYNRTAGVVDDEDAIDDTITQEETEKLGVSWNAGLADYSTFGPKWIGLYRRTRIRRLLRYPKPLRDTISERSNDLSARFGATYSKATVRYQREKIRELLVAQLDTSKLNRRGYMKELKQSKVVLSPFGWGEITLKDFEVFLTGGALLKPSMDHMQTWPNLYESNVTYMPHEWDLSNLQESINWAIENEFQRSEIAAEGQRRYAEHTSGPHAAEIFTDHFNLMINDILSSPLAPASEPSAESVSSQ